MSNHFLRNSIVLVFTCMVWPLPLHAAVSVSEVMYDLPGADDAREWIEIYTDTSADTTDWKLFEGGVRHKLTSVQGGSIIPADGYAVIASDAQAFLAEYPGFSGILFDSSFSLKNSGENFSLRMASGTDIAPFAYDASQGGGGDGSSLQMVAGSLVAAQPTPGRQNAVAPRSAATKTAPQPMTEKPDAVQTEALPRSALPAVLGAATHSEPLQDFVPWVTFFALALLTALGAVFVARTRSRTEALSAEDFDMIDISKS